MTKPNESFFDSILTCCDCGKHYKKKPTDGLLVCRYCKGQISPMNIEAIYRRDMFEKRMRETHEKYKDDIPARNKEFDRMIPLALTWIGDDERGFAYDRVEYVIRKNKFHYAME